VQIAVEITLVRVKNTLKQFEIRLVHVAIADLFFCFIGGGELITRITHPMDPRLSIAASQNPIRIVVRV
jgi:hypothetical protein